jgi:GNAT superfamily N-acetyltransferase
VVTYEWRGAFGNAEVNALHADGFGHRLLDDDWLAQVSRHSLGWVCARDGRELIDTLVAGAGRHRGVGTRLVAIAEENARAAGCEWLHVEFDKDLGPFYFASCGFRPTTGGLIAL